MRRSSITGTLFALLLIATLAAPSLAKPQVGTGVRFVVAMTGAEEVPVLGDPDGSGTATLRLNPGQGTVCYHLVVSNIAPATAAHIHKAPAGDPGPVVVGLGVPTSGESSGCTTADRDLILDIIQNPEGYYVNVHNAPFSAGAVRGQLG